MIATIQGVLTAKKPTIAVVTVGGMGLDIHIPVSTYEQLPALNEEVLLHTHLHVREDALKLFGFASATEKILFSTVISVSGIGPSLGLSILSGCTVTDFANALAQEDLKAITAIPGIGKKTAQRMVVELKDKVAAMANTEVAAGVVAPEENTMTTDALAALMSLGMKENSARNALNRVLKESDDDLTVQTLIRKALKYA